MLAIEKCMAGGVLQTGTGAMLLNARAHDSTVTDCDSKLVTSSLVGGVGQADGYVQRADKLSDA